MSKFKYRRFIVGLLLLLTAGSGMTAYGKSSWEALKNEPTELKTVIKHTDVEIKTASGMIVVTTQHPVQIQIFTILGQMISTENVGAGIYRLQLNAHGVYIVKIGDRTVKVAL